MTIRTAIARVDSISSDIREILGEPPLLSTEDKKNYDAMMCYFAAEFQPGESDLILWCLLKDLADHRIEIARYRRIKAALIPNAHQSTAKGSDEDGRSNATGLKCKRRAMGEMTKQEAIDDYAAGLDMSLEEMFSELQARGWETGFLSAANGANNIAGSDAWIGYLERIDELLTAAENRFSVTLNDIERHVSGLGTRVSKGSRMSSRVR